MAGPLLALARKDAKKIIKSGGFEENISITTPTNDKTTVLTGFATKHHINFDTDGLPTNTKNVHISIDEDDLKADDYPVRNARNEVALIDHIVEYNDSTGETRKYTVNETFPDEVLGIIVCILTDFIE